MGAQLPDQSVYTGFIPKDLYNQFLGNKALYDQQGKSYPYHYYQYYGIPYKVSYGDPYTLIDYVDVSTPVYNPVVGVPGVPPGVTIVVAPPVITPPSFDMTLPGMGVPDPNKVPQPVITTPTPVTVTVPITTPGTDTGSGTGGFGGNAAAWAWIGMIVAIGYGFSNIRRRKARK